ncbi:hypothetical protein DBR47_18490 [Paucibacter sp. KBW04]|uniref:MMPL family transporter n=1 Tax=Paucibacter sp. KBW04 TaxID=2153361 RepID=UPI000F56B57E|nr:hypothetical protein [Paucibacter sp. KBW04]RQO55866.1 hypothetical protein DBR47_18490 [Paucibacter sp. KBW04]
MTETSSPPRWLRWLAWLWLAWALVVAGHNVWLWTASGFTPDTDVLAMLPQDERDVLVSEATRRLADAGARRVVVMVGANDQTRAQAAGDAMAERLAKASELGLQLKYRVSEQAAADWLNFFSPHRQHLLSQAGRKALQEQAPQALAEQAVAALYMPVSQPRVGSWQSDPLNLFGQWLAERSQLSRVRVQNGRLILQEGERSWAVLMLETQGSGFASGSGQALKPVLAQGQAAAQALGEDVRVLAIGVPLFAAAAAEQAQREVHTIGLGSLAGIIVLTLFAFSSLRPRLLVTLSIVVGLLSAISICSLLFERLHLITLVFGASLVGVAENYGTNYFCARLGLAPEQRFAMLRRQASVMWLAMLTTAIGYALLAVTPFPGLQQIALFSALGLICSFVSVMLWFPLLDGGRLDTTRFSRWLGGRRAYWPSLGRNRFSAGLGLGLALILLLGGLRLQSNDDIRLLQNAPADLVAQQRELSRLMDLPGVAQFFLVQGDSEEQVLQREEALKLKLDELQARGLLAGYQALSDWVPSQARQQADAALRTQALPAVLSLAATRLGQELQPEARPDPISKPLRLHDFLQAPVSEPLRHQWLGSIAGGYASAVLLRGVDSAAKLQALAALSAPQAGVRWVDKVAEVSGLMGRYRHIMAGVIVLAYLLVWAALAWRFGASAWRALAPTALASLLTVALLALLNQPLQLFHVLPLLILLGLGVDYGIFMLEQPEPHLSAPFLSITLAAACTLLSFGLLALSGTPALRAFGLTLLIGVSLAWVLTPLFMPADTASHRLNTD